jgi:hypothetical protein
LTVSVSVAWREDQTADGETSEGSESSEDDEDELEDEDESGRDLRMEEGAALLKSDEILKFAFFESTLRTNQTKKRKKPKMKRTNKERPKKAANLVRFGRSSSFSRQAQRTTLSRFL